MTITKFSRKVRKKIRRFFVLHNPVYKNSRLLTENKKDEKFIRYYERKYRSFINNLPRYKSTHKYSNKIWWCWFQGEENAPDLCKACLASLRKNAKNREIIVITKNNYSDFVKLPLFVTKKIDDGSINFTQLSDILRLELLIKYGGTWIDSSVLMTGYDNDYFDKDIFVFKSFLNDNDAISSSSWFITSEIDNPILKTTRDLIYEHLRHNNEFDRYYTLHIFFTIARKRYPELWDTIPTIPNTMPHILQFEMKERYSQNRYSKICEISSVHKLSQHIDFSDEPKDTNYRHIINTYLKEK